MSGYLSLELFLKLNISALRELLQQLDSGQVLEDVGNVVLYFPQAKL
jgi:hypothetical protein